MLGQGASFIVGIDIAKDPATLVAAYDDARGVTAAFNKNLLTRINRELGADFDLSTFEHQAIWNAAESRMEMHLVSCKDQVAHVAGRAYRFGAGETIHTENSYKFTLARFADLAGSAGWRVASPVDQPRPGVWHRPTPRLRPRIRHAKARPGDGAGGSQVPRRCLPREGKTSVGCLAFATARAAAAARGFSAFAAGRGGQVAVLGE